ncbi:MAG: asparagine synthase (glutamine-hydrolyzing) [Ginsengibacter sp.]
MCGIAGVYNCQTANSKQLELKVKGMLSVIQHRGPDESGLYIGNNSAIGAVRLSIKDIKNGHQPLSDQSGNYWIVYNGEIFNDDELRSIILNKGIQLKTRCDTEIVVQMYALFGADCLKYFNGQFAFCIYNKVSKELFFARDRMGIRPLFYSSSKDSFAFCSEIKGLFTLDHIKREICAESLAQIFTFWTTISPHTPFENIYELPPGHYMVVNSNKIQIKKYYSLDFTTNSQHRLPDNLTDKIEELDHILKDAVNIRLKADVQVGAYLSGGLDSSITTSYINDYNPGILNTFSIGFRDSQYDESEYQLLASKHFKSNHSIFLCSSSDIAEQFPKTIWHTEFPILRTSPTPMLLLSKRVRESNIKVIITGEGADEMFGGYNIFKENKLRRFWANQPDSLVRPQLLSRIYPYLPNLKSKNNLAAKMFFGYKLADTSNPFYSHLIRWHNTSRIKALLSDHILEKIKKYDPFEELQTTLPYNFMRWSDLSKSQYLESSIFMSNYLLSSQGDRVAMGNSVEGRYPFLDYRVMEFAGNLRDNFKLNCLNEKFILKKLGIGKIPDHIRNRPKQPYRAPITESFFHKNAPEYISEILSDKQLDQFGIFNSTKVNKLIFKIKSQDYVSEIDQMSITGILSTQLLYKFFISVSILKKIDTLKNINIVNES